MTTLNSISAIKSLKKEHIPILVLKLESVNQWKKKQIWKTPVGHQIDSPNFMWFEYVNLPQRFSNYTP